MGKTKKELLNDVGDSLDLAELVAFYNIEPGHFRPDIRSAIVSKTVADCHCGKPVELVNFIPQFKKTKAMTEKEMKLQFGIVDG